MNKVFGLVGAFVGLCLVPVASPAATMSWSAERPVVNGSDIASFTGTSADANNIQGGDDNATFIAANRPPQGQMFTTGGSPGGYTLSAIALQHVNYTTSWSLDTGWTKVNGGRFQIQIGTVDGNVFSPIATEDAYMTDSAPANQMPGTGSAQYVTLTLDSPVKLAANTEYAFVVTPINDPHHIDAPFFEINGTGSYTDIYPGGEAISLTGTFFGGDLSNRIVRHTGDRVFYLDISERKAGHTDATKEVPDEVPVPKKKSSVLLQNRSFEVGNFAGWEKRGKGWSIDDTRFSDGSFSALCTVNKGDKPELRACVQKISGVAAGKLVEVSVDVSGMSVIRTTSSKACLAVLFFDAGGQVLKEYRSTVVRPSSEFQTIKIDDAVVLQGTTEVYVMLVVEVYQPATDRDLWRFDNAALNIY